MRSVDYPEPFRELARELRRLPGIGPRTAERIALWLVFSKDARPLDLAASLRASPPKIFARARPAASSPRRNSAKSAVMKTGSAERSVSSSRPPTSSPSSERAPSEAATMSSAAASLLWTTSVRNSFASSELLARVQAEAPVGDHPRPERGCGRRSHHELPCGSSLALWEYPSPASPMAFPPAADSSTQIL